MVWCLRRSWCSFSAWMLALTLSLMKWVRWPPVWVVLHDIRLVLVASLLLPLHLHKLQRTRMMMMASVMMMMMRMRMMMLALPVMRRWLLLSDLPFFIRDKSSFGYKSSHVPKGRVSIRFFFFFLGGVFLFMRDIVRIYVSFLFFLI